MTIYALVGQLLLGWLLADFLSGLFHWWEDRCGRADMPVIGRWIVAPNRLHHVRPLAFAEGSLVRRNLPVWLLTGVVALVWLLVAGPSPLWAATSIGGLVVNEVHRLAHRPQLAGPILATLQQTGVIQSPKHHAGHHRPSFDRRYCILTDWLNPVLDALKVWAGLEALLDRVGLTPNRGTL